MNCEEALAAISAALDGELSREEQSALSGHLLECPDCRALAEDFRVLSAALDDLEQAPPQSLARSILDAAAAESTAPLPAKKRRFPPYLRTLAAMLALAVCIGGAGLYLSRAGADQNLSVAGAPSGAAPASTESASDSALPESGDNGSLCGGGPESPQAAFFLEPEAEADGSLRSATPAEPPPDAANEAPEAIDSPELYAPEGLDCGPGSALDKDSPVTGAAPCSSEQAAEQADGYLYRSGIAQTDGWTAILAGLSDNGRYYLFTARDSDGIDAAVSIAVPLYGGDILDSRSEGYTDAVEN